MFYVSDQFHRLRLSFYFILFSFILFSEEYKTDTENHKFYTVSTEISASTFCAGHRAPVFRKSPVISPHVTRIPIGQTRVPLKKYSPATLVKLAGLHFLSENDPKSLLVPSNNRSTFLRINVPLSLFSKSTHLSSLSTFTLLRSHISTVKTAKERSSENSCSVKQSSLN